MPDNFLYANKYVLVGKIDSAGYAAGQVADPEAVTPPVTSGALVLPTVIDTGAMGVTRAVYSEEDGAEVKQIIDGGVQTVAPFTINLGRHSAALAALSHNAAVANVDTVGTVGTITQGGIDLTPTTLNNCFVAVLTNRSEKTSTGYAPGRWHMKLYGLCQLSPNDVPTNQNTGANPIPDTWTVTPSKTTKSLWGQLWSALALGYANGETFMHPMDGRDPFYIANFWADGTATSFTMPYLPKYADVAITGRNMIFKAGVRTAVTSFSITTGAMVIATAGTTGDKWSVIYPSTYATA